MRRPLYFRRFRTLHHRIWMGCIMVMPLAVLIPACKLTGPEGVANGTQSLYASEVLASHNSGIEKSGFRVPESLGLAGRYRQLDWIFTHAQPFTLPALNAGQLNLTSLTYEDLSRTQDPYYCAMRWDYGNRPEVGRKFFANRKLIVISAGTVLRAVVVRIVDWGPPVTSAGGIALSRETLSALGVSSGDMVGVAFEASDTEKTGPVVLGVQ